MKEAFVEFRKNKEKKKLKMIKELLSEATLERSWERISTKSSDILKQKYYQYYIKSLYTNEIAQITEQK
jgi:hypothetical protein